MKVKIILSILFITFITGCGAEKAMGEPAQANPKMEMQAAIEMPDRLQMGELMDNVTVPSVKLDTNSYISDRDNVINFEEVREAWKVEWSWISELDHEFEVENQVTDDYIPEKLINVLERMHYVNRDNQSYDEVYKDCIAEDYISYYQSDKEKVAEELSSMVIYGYFLRIDVIDLDYDNENEYLVTATNGIHGEFLVDIYDTRDGKIEFLYEAYPLQDDCIPALLEIDNKYFILQGAWANFYDPRDHKWREIGALKSATGYTPYEFYSNTQLEDKKIFEGVNLVDREEGWKLHYRDLYYYDDWIGYPRILEREMDGETYYYVRFDIDKPGLNNACDEILFIIKELDNGKYEIVKAYYLVADVNMVIADEDIDPKLLF